MTADQSVQRIDASGLAFGYFEAGPADGPLALCLHGFPDSAHTWRHLLPRLGDAGYHAVAPFTRGYAPTSVPADGAYETGALAADANALHDALGGGEDAVLIGHDWGAITAYAALAHSPRRWRRGVTMAVPPPLAMASAFFDFGQVRRSFYIFVFQTAFAEGILGSADMAFIDGLWDYWSVGYDATEDLRHVKAALAGEENRRAAIGYYRAMLGTDPPQDAYAAESAAAQQVPPQPVLYLHGGADGCLAVELAGEAPAYLSPESRTDVVPGTGHFLHLEAPDEVGDRVLSWLSG